MTKWISLESWTWFKHSWEMKFSDKPEATRAETHIDEVDLNNFTGNLGYDRWVMMGLSWMVLNTVCGVFVGHWRMWSVFPQ